MGLSRFFMILPYSSMAASSALLCMEDTEECDEGLDEGKNETLFLQRYED